MYMIRKAKFRFNPKNYAISDKLCRVLVAGFEDNQWSAMNMTEDLVKQDENNALSWIVKAMLEERDEDYDDALDSIEKALMIDHHNALAWGIKGDIDCSFNAYIDALASYDNSIKYSNEFEISEALLNKIKLLIDIKKNNDAMNTVNELLEKFPQNIDGLYHKCFILKNSQRYNEALQIIQQGLEIAPKHVDLMNLMGTILLEMKKVEQALEYFDNVTSISPSNYTAWKNKAKALLMLNRDANHALAVIDMLDWNNKSDDEKYR